MLSAAEKLHSDIGQGHEAQGKEEGCPDVLDFRARLRFGNGRVPDSVDSDCGSASLALARCVELAVISIRPAGMSSPVRTLPFSV